MGLNLSPKLTAVGDGGADLTSDSLLRSSASFWQLLIFPSSPVSNITGRAKILGLNSQKWDFYWKSRFSIFFYFLKMEGISFHLSVTLFEIFSKRVSLFFLFWLIIRVFYFPSSSRNLKISENFLKISKSFFWKLKTSQLVNWTFNSF